MKLVSTRTWYGGPRAVLWAKNIEVGTCFTWLVSASLVFGGRRRRPKQAGRLRGLDKRREGKGRGGEGGGGYCNITYERGGGIVT